MPLWDSVQRSLEKASQEAARIARTQRLRSTIDGLLRQINTHNSTIVNKTMELYLAGQLTQSELIPRCHEMINLHPQVNQAQNELKQLQMQAPPPPPGSPGMQGVPGMQNTPAPQAPAPPGITNPGQYPPPITGEVGQASYPNPTTEGGQNAMYAPPPPGYQSYLDSTNDYTVPPPPPGMEGQTVSSLETFIVSMSTPQTSNRLCPVCHSEIPPTIAFCHNCGTPVQEGESQHLPTMRGGTIEQVFTDNQATQAVSPGSSGAAYGNQNTPGKASTPAPDLESDQETVRANAPVQIPPPPPNHPAQAAEQDKGV